MIYPTDGSVGYNVCSLFVTERLRETAYKVRVIGELTSTFIEFLAIRHAVRVAIMNGDKKLSSFLVISQLCF